MLDQNYYPKIDGAIHPVNSWAYVRSILRALRRGETIPPILCESDGAGLLAGTHRAAANDLAAALGYSQRIEIVNLVDLDEDDPRRVEIQKVIEDDSYGGVVDYERIDQIWDRAE